MIRRGVAQPGSAFGLGPKGRRFKSSHPDIFYLTFVCTCDKIYISQSRKRGVMTSNRDIEKLFDQWNPNGIRAGDRVQVNVDSEQPYPARVVGLDLDMKNQKVYANLRLLSESVGNKPIRVDVADCYVSWGIYRGHHE